MGRARRWLAAAAIAVAVLVQLCLVVRVPLPGAVPDLVLLVVVALALATGPSVGACAGFSAGLAQDLVPPADHAAGRWALVLTVVGYAAGVVGRRRGQTGNRPRLLVCLATVAAAAAGSLLLYAMLGGISGDTPVPLGAALRLVPAAVAYDLVLTPFVVRGALLLAARRSVPTRQH